MVYTTNMRFEWDENKNNKNISVHGIDFRDAHLIFENPVLIKKDNRKDYGEERLIGLGELFKVTIIIIFTKRASAIRVISIRRANENERKIYQEKFKKKSH